MDNPNFDLSPKKVSNAELKVMKRYLQMHNMTVRTGMEMPNHLIPAVRHVMWANDMFTLFGNSLLETLESVNELLDNPTQEQASYVHMMEHVHSELYTLLYKLVEEETEDDSHERTEEQSS